MGEPSAASVTSIKDAELQKRRQLGEIAKIYYSGNLCNGKLDLESKENSSREHLHWSVVFSDDIRVAS